MSAYRCPLCNETGHTSMDCPSVARRPAIWEYLSTLAEAVENDAPPPANPAKLLDAIRAVLDDDMLDDEGALRAIEALLRVAP